MIPFSILDLSPVIQGATPADALRNTLDLAQHAEKWGYRRYWLAEHHNMPGIASAATSIVIAYVPNHAPLVIAEQFGTLASLYPGRIDLGLGRAPGTDMLTTRALRRDPSAADQFPRDVQELQYYFQPAEPTQKVRAVPGAGLDVPIWLLGSSLFSAQLAALLGLPFAFASHFAPDDRELFKPSKQLDHPYAMVGANVIVAATDAEARRLFSSVQQSFISLRRGTPGQLPPPIDDINAYASHIEKANVDHSLSCSFVGSPETVTRGLQSFLDSTHPDELILTAHIYDHAARLHSVELTAQLRHNLTSRNRESNEAPAALGAS